MDKYKWDCTVTHFQARARGYLLRNEVRRAREDFEDIVKEIHGGLDCLRWVKKALYFPHFTDTHNDILPFKNLATNLDSSRSEPRDCSTPADHGVKRDDDGGGGGLPEKLVAERDVSEISGFTTKKQDCFYSAQKVDNDTKNEGDAKEKEKVVDGDSTTVWNSTDMDMDSCRSVKGLRQYCLARDVPRTPEALRGHRNTLSMELLWLQQAIDSRKKYLSLKNKLSDS